MQQLRIVHLSHCISQKGGGVATVAAALARQQSQGHDVHVIGGMDPEEPLEDSAYEGATLHPVSEPPIHLWAVPQDADRILAALSPDIVHLHGLWTHASIVARRWRRRAPSGRLIISPHGMLEPWALQNSGLKKRLGGALFMKSALRHGDALHALTTQESQEITQYLGGGRIAEIPNGAPPPGTPGTLPPFWPDGRRVLFYLGRLHPKKNLSFLIRIWSQLPSNLRANWCLAIAGWDQGDHRAELEALAQKLGVSDTVIFSGALFGPGKEAAYHAADGFVLPSLSEGLPMVVLEAWSHGTPVLMTDACNLVVGFDHGGAQRLDPSPERGLADLVQFLSLPVAERAAMGANGRALARQNFSWSAVSAKFLALYENLLSDTNNKRHTPL